MHLVCLDLEGVLVPEIWISFSEYTGIPEFRRTTRDEPDYDKLMAFRIDLLAQHKLTLPDIQRVIGSMEPLPGALDFIKGLRDLSQFIILSDTFEEFAKPLLAKLGQPLLFCNSLETAPDGYIKGYRLRQQNGKKCAVTAFKTLGYRVFAAGDSYNDIAMIQEAHGGSLFRAPEGIQKEYPQFPCTEAYEELLAHIKAFIGS
ncbi:MAG: bifunctional phosphoserine phosphatase/homoserine phosphotransferase ThrH [Treponema sp.]|nr:bifunctional phosphoserine phosphatase/homoserine phosphotransferase ThrH [Treponema sp.]